MRNPLSIPINGINTTLFSQCVGTHHFRCRLGTESVISGISSAYPFKSSFVLTNERKTVYFFTYAYWVKSSLMYTGCRLRIAGHIGTMQRMVNVILGHYTDGPSVRTFAIVSFEISAFM